VTAASEIGYFLTPNFAVTATVGIPPTTRATGTGPLAGAGLLGSVEYGFADALINYHFNNSDDSSLGSGLDRR